MEKGFLGEETGEREKRRVCGAGAGRAARPTPASLGADCALAGGCGGCTPTHHPFPPAGARTRDQKRAPIRATAALDRSFAFAPDPGSSHTPAVPIISAGKAASASHRGFGLKPGQASPSLSSRSGRESSRALDEQPPTGKRGKRARTAAPAGGTRLKSHAQGIAQSHGWTLLGRIGACPEAAWRTHAQGRARRRLAARSPSLSLSPLNKLTVTSTSSSARARAA